VSADGGSWYLLNASPDLRAQVLSAPELAPAEGTRDSPIRGVLLSTAELDHALGLLALREAKSLTVYGSAAVLSVLDGPFPVRALLAPYTTVTWTLLPPDHPMDLDGGLTVRAIPVGAKPPRYAAGHPGDDWAVALQLTDRGTGGVLVYAPCLPAWGEPFASTVDTADCVLLDGTFLGEDEMGAGRAAASMGHLPIETSLPLLPRRPGQRILYTHLNNTNPFTADERSGAEAAVDGRTFTV
jgi:pyrroloquinoline quinone biosynthesis protein B